MAEADLSKIVGLIMENPKLIEEIRALTKPKEKPEEAVAPTEEVSKITDLEVAKLIIKRLLDALNKAR